MISEDFINELKNRCDIEYIISTYVDLKKAGKNKVGRCPFHSEKTPSMVVFADTQSFYCFGCGQGGDVITFVKNIENLSYVEAVNFLAKKVGLPIPENTKEDKTYLLRNKLIKINQIAAKHFFKNLTNQDSHQVKDYLVSREIRPEFVKKFGLGYAKDSWNDITNLLLSKGFSEEEILSSNLAVKSKNGNLFDTFRGRLIFPIIDLMGNVIAFGGRLLDNNLDNNPDQNSAQNSNKNSNYTKPKYLNSSDTLVFKKSNNLFSLNFCKNTKKNYIILSEGYMDVVALYQAGFDNAVATLGTALTSNQARLLSKYTSEVVISYDSDSAGQQAATRAINILSEVGISSKVLDIKNAKDPDEYIKKFGKERFSFLIRDSQNIFEYQIEKLKKKFDFSVSQDKINFLKEVVLILSKISNQIEREVFISKISDELKISREVISLQVRKIIKKQIAKDKKTQQKAINTIKFNNNQSDKSNIKSITTENKIITVLLKSPDFHKIALESNLQPENFVDATNKDIYNIILQRLQNNLSIDITSLSNVMSEDAIKKIAYLIACDMNVNFDYINVLLDMQQFSEKDFSKMNNDELKDYFLKIKKQK